MIQCLKCFLPIRGNHERYGLHPECFAQCFGVPKEVEFTSLQDISTSSSSGSDFSSPSDSFFQGKFKKYSAQLHNENYILKLRQRHAPELPDVEYLCNQIAKILLINVAPFYLITLNNERVFVTKNFLQPEIGDDLQHIHLFRANNEHTCEGLIRVIKEKTLDPIHVDTFIKMILFDALIMNHDRHGRNLALIARQNTYHLSPIYDNVSCLSLQEGDWLKMDFDFRGKIATLAVEKPNMADYVIELIRLGYKESVVQFYQHLKFPAWEAILYKVEQSFCSDLMKEAFKKILNKRAAELKHALFS